MPRYTSEVMYELAKSPLSGLDATNTDLNSLKVIKRRESLLYRKSFGNNQDALRRFREEAEERKPVEISIDVEDVAESDISLTEYANRYLSQKGNTGRKAKGGDAVHPKFAIALAATQAKTSKSGRGGSSNAFAAFADADENNDESAVAEEDDDDGWNTVPARHQVPTHPWHRAAARKSFGADHHRPSFNSSNKTTGVYLECRGSSTSDASARSTRRSSTRRESFSRRDDAFDKRYFDPFAHKPSPVGPDKMASFEWNVETDKRYPRGPKKLSPEISPLTSFATVATVAPLTPPGLNRELFQTPLTPPQDGGVQFKPNYFEEAGPSVGQAQMTPVGHTVGHGPFGLGVGSMGSPMGANSQVPMGPNSPMNPMTSGSSPPGMTPMGMPGGMAPPSMAPGCPLPGPFFAVVLPPEIVDQIQRGLLPPPPPPPPMHMMWRGGPLPPGVGIPVPVMPWQ